MLVGHTSGGSPIYHNTGSGKRSKKSKNPRLACTRCHHHTTGNAAANNAYHCIHCKAPLKVRAEKIKQLRNLARKLRYELVPIKE